MNILEKKEMLEETINTIKVSIELLNGKIIMEHRNPTKGIHEIMFRFHARSEMKIMFDLFNNFIYVYSYYLNMNLDLNLKNEVLKMYNTIGATPKKNNDSYNNSIYHYFKISKKNCERLYRIFVVMANYK